MDVVHGSPAFQGGVMTGDVFVAIDGTPIRDRASLKDFLATRLGRPVHFTGLRAGRSLELVVTLGRPS